MSFRFIEEGWKDRKGRTMKVDVEDPILELVSPSKRRKTQA